MDAYADLVVLVHGYSGSAYDVRLMRSYLQLQLATACLEFARRASIADLLLRRALVARLRDAHRQAATSE